MSDQPLGVQDLLGALPANLFAPEHWYWCRRHEQAHKVNDPCLWRPFGTHTDVRESGSPCSYQGSLDFGIVGRDGLPNDEKHSDGSQCSGPSWCKDIGPFMSEREANRLSGGHTDTRCYAPLGMEIER